MAEYWLLTADEGHARLYRAGWSAVGNLQLSAEDEIHDSWAVHQHTCPQPPEAIAGQAHASLDHEDETRRNRFAKEIAVWLERSVDGKRIDQLDVFAPSRFINALRDAWSARLAILLHEHRGDLTNLTASELADHPAILAIMHGDQESR